jgi:hypothetical protein
MSKADYTANAVTSTSTKCSESMAYWKQVILKLDSKDVAEYDEGVLSAVLRSFCNELSHEKKQSNQSKKQD